MTDVEKLLALITIQAAAMTKHQQAACNAAWLKLLDEKDEARRIALEPANHPLYGPQVKP